jgi:hypothetical protein
MIETKGCWNAELSRALEAQLYRAYMMRLHAPMGVYLVGWFAKTKWDATPARRRRAPNCTLLETQARLDAQAQAIPAGFLSAGSRPRLPRTLMAFGQPVRR